MSQTIQAWLKTSWGPIRCTFEGKRLTELHFGGSPRSVSTPSRPAFLAAVEKQIDDFLCGHSRRINLSYRRQPGTEFQRKVWQETARIPYGKVRTYGQIAERVGHPEAARAVGQALGRNCLPLLVPCHRVVAAGGKLGGFTGGLDKKRRLLRLEGSLRDDGSVADASFRKGA